MKTISTIFLLLINISNVLAETSDTQKPLKEYDIEIIIFEDAHARYINSESWNKSSLPGDDLIADNSGKNTSTATNYKDIKHSILSKDYKRIKNSSEYNVLQYSAWRQTGLKSNDAFEINITKLNNTHRNQTKNTLSGTVKIVLARYLHFYGDLEYQQLNKANDENNGEAEQNDGFMPTNNSYAFKSHRRMRSKELHYIDHPLVGILIQINPVETSPENQAN